MRAQAVRTATLGILAVLLSAALIGEDIPLANWAVPPYRTNTSVGGMTPMADISSAVAFVAMQPCRVVDTRGGGVFTGAYGPPNMAAGATRTFDINSAPHCPGIPGTSVAAYSLNFTVTQTAGPLGDIRAWPTGALPVQITSVLNWTVTGATVANATIIPAGFDGAIDVQVAGSSTHLLIDINGYFAAEQNPGQRFRVLGSGIGPVIYARNSAADPGAEAVRGELTAGAATFGSTGVRGIATGDGAGVWGSSELGFGVRGTVSAGTAVFGAAESTTEGGTGVWGVIQSPSLNSAGVRGTSIATTGVTFGVVAINSSSSGNSAGLLGNAGLAPNTGSTVFDKSGVRGQSKDGNGTIGVSEATAVGGFLMNPADGTLLAQGRLGTLSGNIPYGMHSIGDAHVQGLLTANTKAFVEPHPSDASKEIRYVSLEGRHSEVYFRGTAQVSRGVTRIPIPEDFRIVADPATYSTLVTPVGGMATVAVVSEGADGIVIQASRDIRVHYVVYAEREAVRNPEPIVENVHFRPDPEVDFLGNLPESYRRRMIQNGTLNADGTANMETARRLGWDRMWEKRDTTPKPRPEEGSR